MVFKRSIRYLYKSDIIKSMAGDEIPILLRYFRGAEVVRTRKLIIFASLYRLFLKFASHLLFIPVRYRVIFQAVQFLHIHNDCEGAVSKFEDAALRSMPAIDRIIMHLVQIEFLANTESSTENSILILQFADSLTENEHIKYQLALRFLGEDRLNEAKKLLMEAIQMNVAYAMSHQNMAAKYNVTTWTPQPLDLLGDVECHLYDAYHLWGQNLVNSGDAATGLLMFGNAMAIQRVLSRRYFLPPKLIEELASLPGYNRGKETRIVPYEWVTQIGHLGMLDALIKMCRLGMRPDVNWILLAPKDKVVNPEYLKCWQEYFVIVGEKALVDKLFPYQRICGEQFNCYIREDGSAMDWSDAASQVFREWDARQFGSLISPPKTLLDSGRKKLEALGLPKGTWYVCLHARASGFYAEGLGFIQKHRNAPLSSYIPAIEHITQNGGWVIRMGDPTMPKLPVMRNVIDIAHSPYKNKKLDVYLWSQCRFFIGTTSGPTNAVVSFHTPALLVNCVTNYAQSWNSRVVFVLKPFWSVSKNRFLRYSEAFTSQLRPTMFSGRSMNRVGIRPMANSKQDILQATAEMLELVERDDIPKMQDPGTLINSGLPMWLWGNAHPSKSYLENHPELLN